MHDTISRCFILGPCKTRQMNPNHRVNVPENTEDTIQFGVQQATHTQSPLFPLTKLEYHRRCRLPRVFRFFRTFQIQSIMCLSQVFARQKFFSARNRSIFEFFLSGTRSVRPRHVRRLPRITRGCPHYLHRGATQPTLTETV